MVAPELKLSKKVTADQTGQSLDTELDLRHAPLIIHESGCNGNTKDSEYTTSATARQALLDGGKSPILKREDATRDRSACLRLFIFGLRQFRLCRNHEAFGPENERAS